MPRSSKAGDLTSRLVVGLAGFKLAVALAATVAAASFGSIAPSVVPPAVTGLIVVTYAGVGLALIFGGFSDPRCRSLGLFFLIVATAFGDALSIRGHSLGGLTATGVAIRLDVLLPAMLWWFVAAFPSPPTTRAAARWLQVATAVSAASAAVLIVVNGFVDAGWSRAPLWMNVLSRGHKSNGLFWPVLFALMVPAAAAMAARVFRGGAAERRAVRLFATAILAGLLPLALDVGLRAISPGWRGVVHAPAAASAVQTLVVLALLTVPFTAAYAVLVARVADIRLVLRTALQYGLARYTVVVLVVLPLVWIVQFIYANRLLTIEQLASSRATLALAGGLIAAGVALATRQRALDHLDRRFFREHYDTERVIHSVMTATRSQPSGQQLAALLAAEVDRTLHVERVVLLLREDRAGAFVARDGDVRPLSDEATIVRLLSASDDPLDVDPENPQSVLRRLDATEVHWLVDGGFRLLVPLRGPDGSALGILALGEKKSELPYSAADRRLLSAIGASGGLGLARQRSADAPATTENPARADDAALAARECLNCGRVHAAGVAGCACGGSLIAAPVPALLAGKFALECRLGAGGMGVVYRAKDVTLGRMVAVKTLPISGPAETWRLRREARAMALVSHEHLALIYGIESWHGHPFLIVEYLAGGTLSDRLRRGRLTANDALRLGQQLCEVLERLHAAGLLHRDLKPSNVGFTASGESKLLDFGLAQLVAPGAGDTTRSGSAATTGDALNRRTHHGFGTPAYMSPEAMSSGTPSPAFDLWSLGVLLVEALSGTNPFGGRNALDIAQRLNHHRAEHVAAMLPGCSAPIIAFFEEALHPNANIRPASASVFGERLKILSHQ